MAAKSNYHKKQKSAQTSVEEQVVIGILKGLWWLISLPYRLLTGKGTGINFGVGKSQSITPQMRRDFEEYWGGVDYLLAQPGQLEKALFEADKVLDRAMQVIGVSGDTMGERLKSCEIKYEPSLYNDIWTAHKMRNHLAHEVGASLNESEIRQAIDVLRRAVQALGLL